MDSIINFDKKDSIKGLTDINNIRIFNPNNNSSNDNNIDYKDGSSLKILIIHTRWNFKIIESLVSSAIKTLTSELNVKSSNIFLEQVPGSYELPWACSSILSNPKSYENIDAIIAIGTLIKGETMHFEYISESVSNGLMKASITHNKPIIFGVLTCLNETQAHQRAGLTPNSHNHGQDWAKVAVECALKSKSFKSLDHSFKSVADLNSS